jgi:hypothetical protein
MSKIEYILPDVVGWLLCIANVVDSFAPFFGQLEYYIYFHRDSRKCNVAQSISQARSDL